MATFEVGDEIEAVDEYGKWHGAAVVGARGTGPALVVQVHHHGWSATHEFWRAATSTGLRAPPSAEAARTNALQVFGTLDGHVEDDVHQMEEVRGRKGGAAAVRWLVHWKGYPDTADSWEPTRHVSADLRNDYLALSRLPSPPAPKAKRQRAPRPPPVPYCRASVSLKSIIQVWRTSVQHQEDVHAKIADNYCLEQRRAYGAKGQASGQLWAQALMDHTFNKSTWQ